ncbi:MAG TPA: ATP-binding protein [Flavobacterium sp.]|nr:ATP-binding protein [Flavobacterium sp.]
MKIKKTYPKILLLIFSSSIFFIFLYIALYNYTTKVEKQVYETSKEQFNNEVNKLLVLDSKPISVAVNNDTNWDEFVDFTNTRDSKWYNETIGNELDIYKADYLGTYGTDHHFIIRTASPKIKTADFIPKSAMQRLDKTGLARFYVRLPEGVAEVIGATIHPSDDPLKKTKSHGYFFAARLMDKSFLHDLEKLTNSEIRFAGAAENDTIGKHRIFARVYLKDSQGNTVAKLVFKRNFEVYFDNMIDILYVIMALFFVNLILNFIFTRKWVYYPLDLITQVLETGSRSSIKKLKESTGEFRSIGNLFEENRQQKTELIKAKLKAEEGERLKASFLANLSHEIRTPMNAINGFTDLLLNTKPDGGERLEYLKIIDKSGQNLVSIIDDLIEMSKIDSNQIAPNYAKVNLESCIKELYESIRVTIPKSKNIDFHIIENPLVAKYPIITDEVKLKQVITNLITNAVKFTEKGYVAFGYAIDEKKSRIVFTIKDTGIGIDKDNQEDVFDRFKRVESDASIKAGGLGLGLAISKAYVEMLGGKMTLESAINKGSVFSFSIPLDYDTVQTIVVQPINDTVLPHDEQGLTVLVAEDDNINFMLFKKIMEISKYTIIRAVNGFEAVNICIMNPNIDIVLMDIKMPLMDGFEALEKIKEIRPELHIIAQTAYASSEDRDRIIKAGFSGYVTKPINREELMATIREVLQK